MYGEDDANDVTYHCKLQIEMSVGHVLGAGYAKKYILSHSHFRFHSYVRHLTSGRRRLQ